MVEFDQALANPAAAFARPAEVVDAPGLSREQRVRLLRQWEWDCLQLEVATEENMQAAGSERTPLREIHAALVELGEHGEPGTAGTKFG